NGPVGAEAGDRRLPALRDRLRSLEWPIVHPRGKVVDGIRRQATDDLLHVGIVAPVVVPSDDGFHLLGLEHVSSVSGRYDTPRIPGRRSSREIRPPLPW